MPDKESLARVSVIIPTYNRSQLLRQTVESVLAQTYPNIEIIVVDDGSTDDTARVMAQYAGRITYIRRETNHGGRGNGKIGLQAASGQYINVLDHDDLMMPTKIERQVQVLEARPEIGLVHCEYYYIDEDGNILREVGNLPEGDVLKELLCGDPIWSGGPLVRRQCLDEVGLPTGYCGDWDMWLRLAQAGYPFACVQEPLGAYRILPDSAMANLARLEQGNLDVLDKMFANPQLPADVMAVKEQAYSNLRLYTSYRYYAAGRWEDAQRNLTEALALRPQLLEHPEDLAQFLYNGALDPRVADPVKFITDMFDHLPPEADVLRPYRSQLLSQVYTRLALQNYGLRNITEARQQLAEAIALDPTILEQPEAFADSVCHYAMRLPVDSPVLYADAVLQNLPAGAQRLARVRSHVLSEVSIDCAFQDYFAGRRWLVVRQVLTALRYRPSWLRDRGVVSIFLKSLLVLPAKECGRR
jgi:glycosyltransferase involved in cell wall biosynthesis